MLNTNFEIVKKLINKRTGKKKINLWWERHNHQVWATIFAIGALIGLFIDYWLE